MTAEQLLIERKVLLFPMQEGGYFPLNLTKVLQ